MEWKHVGFGSNNAYYFAKKTTQAFPPETMPLGIATKTTSKYVATSELLDKYGESSPKKS
eukprot:scaffold165234_cov19-Prasinocladus_malaysianus.AAC.2